MGKINKLQLLNKDLLGLLVLILVIVAFFFYLLFYPEVMLFATPDFGLSDIWHFNFALKFILSRFLNQGVLPLWTDQIGNGYPLLAEGQIGSFNLLNLILFNFVPFYIAWNLSYILIFLQAALGTYLYCRVVGFSILTSILCALVFSFSGTFITQINHINLIQTASFIPWVFWATFKLVTKPSVIWVFILIIIVSQQIFSGFPQLFVITLLAVVINLAVLFFLNKQTVAKKRLFLLLLVFILSLGISAVQFFPQLELVANSIRSEGVSPSEATFFSFPLKHLFGFFYPYIHGDPRQGTYPDFIKADGSIFWEVTGYIGILPFILALSSLLLLTRKSIVRMYAFLLFASFLLMLGKYSPLYFLYSFPPLSFFRVPSRFIFIFVWSLVILFGIGFDCLKQKLNLELVKPSFKIFILTVIVLTIIADSLYFAQGYNPRVSVKSWEDTPQTASFLKIIDKDRIYSIGNPIKWNELFLGKGWQDMTPYLYLRNDLSANLNLFWDIPSFALYSGLPTRRYTHLKGLIDSGITISRHNSQATLSAQSARLLAVNNVSHLISWLELDVADNNFILSKIYQTENYLQFPSYNIYQFQNVFPRARMVYKYRKADTVEELQTTLLSEDFKPEEEVILEKEPYSDDSNHQNINQSLRFSFEPSVIFGEDKLKENSDGPIGQKDLYKLDWIKDENQQVELQVETEQEGFLVLADTYYPGWKAFIDGEETEILAANLNQRAIKVEQGSHKVKFSYQPQSFRIGAFISLASHLIIISLLVFPRLFATLRRQDKIRQLWSHP